MALKETALIPLGFKAPEFQLPNVVNGRIESLADAAGERATVVMFICNHCPFVIHVRAKLVEIANAYHSKGVRFIAISSNDVANYPEDSPENMKALAKAMNFPFPYFYDESQEVAKAYNAECTPDFGVFDGELSCVYRGRMDSSSPGNEEPVTGADLTAVLDQILSGEPVATTQHPSMGCNIKWK